MHTILRDKNTPRDEFVFYTERLSKLIVEWQVERPMASSHANPSLSLSLVVWAYFPRNLRRSLLPRANYTKVWLLLLKYAASPSYVQVEQWKKGYAGCVTMSSLENC